MGLAQFKLPIILFPVTLLVIVLFAFTTKYDTDASYAYTKAGNVTVRKVLPVTAGHMLGSYGMMMDATAMCVLGFGFLYAFCRKYTWGGISMNFFICGLCFLWCQVCTCIVHALFTGEYHPTAINIECMISADLVTAAVLITFGVVYGFVSPTQLVLISLIEPLAMKINEHIVYGYLHVADAGGSILTHAFGAFFGLGMTLGMGVRSRHIPEKNRLTNYTSDTFALIGTIVLWVFWPSFNGALLYNDVTVQQRVVINTYLAICASCVAAFAASSVFNKGKFVMLEIQNATLAGGVSIGMCCSFDLAPWVPVLVGALAGTVSSYGYSNIAALMESMEIIDSAGATQLHGIPGVFGALVAGVCCLFGGSNYLFSYDTQWVESSITDRNGGAQFGFVLLGVLVTVLIAYSVGILTGLLMRIPFFDKVKHSDYIDEAGFYHASLKPVYHADNGDTELNGTNGGSYAPIADQGQ